MIAVAICEVGCAADSNTYYAGSPPVAGYVAEAPRVKMEDDGLPSQAPPSARIRQMPDDPFEPYSRNYGGQNPGARDPAPGRPAVQAAGSKPVIPADLPADFRRQLAAAVDNAE
jgi:hypothetical protein